MDEELEERIRWLEIKVENLENYNDTFKEMFTELNKLIDGLMDDRDEQIKHNEKLTSLLLLIESKINTIARKEDNLYKNIKGY